MPANMLKTEDDLRHAVIDRLIAASLREGKPAREATLERWRADALANSSVTGPALMSR